MKKFLLFFGLRVKLKEEEYMFDFCKKIKLPSIPPVGTKMKIAMGDLEVIVREVLIDTYCKTIDIELKLGDDQTYPLHFLRFFNQEGWFLWEVDIEGSFTLDPDDSVFNANLLPTQEREIKEFIVNNGGVYHESA